MHSLGKERAVLKRVTHKCRVLVKDLKNPSKNPSSDISCAYPKTNPQDGLHKDPAGRILQRVCTHSVKRSVTLLLHKSVSS